MLRYISGANGNSGDDALLSEDGGINVRSLPEDVQAVFADIDANGDGVLDMEEFKTMLSTYAVLRKANDEGSVSISTLPAKVQPALKVFDQDGDGTVDPKELMRAAELYQASKKSQRRMRKFIIGLVLFVIALIGINSAMTFMMVELGKETKAAPDGVMRVNAGGGQHGAVVKTAANGEPAPLTTALPDAAFEQLKQFQVDSPTGAHVSLAVQGWYRVPQPTAATGSVVKLITAAGFIILDGTDMTFEETLGTVFTEAGFTVNGRKLLGIYELVGLFNSIDDWAGLDQFEREPGFGLHDFYMEYSTLHKCNMTVGAIHSCVDMYNDTHSSYAEIDGEHYIKIDGTIEMDVDTNAAVENVTFNEFTAIVSTYKSPERVVKRQLNYMHDYQESYCQEKFPTGPEVFNVTGAEKVGETEVDGRVIREFAISTPVTKMQHNFLTGFDGTPYTGTSTVKYFDDKLSGAPVKFSFGGKDIVVTYYEEKEISLPPADDSSWDPSPECLNMTVRDYLKDAYLPAPVSPNVYAFDQRRREVDWCIEEGGCATSADQTPHPDDEDQDQASANSTRKLLFFGKKTTGYIIDKKKKSPFSPPTAGDVASQAASQAAGSGPCSEDTAGQCHALGHDVFGVGKTYTYQFPPDDYKPPTFFSLEMWQNGCGIKSLALTGECPGGAECSVAADWNGDDVCCDDGTYCGPGGSLTGSISYDLLNLIKKENVREFLEDQGIAGSITLELGYSQSKKSKGVATLAVIGELSLDRSVELWRRRLQEEADEQIASFEAEEDQFDPPSSINSRRSLLRGGPNSGHNRPGPSPAPPPVRYCVGGNGHNVQRSMCPEAHCSGAKKLSCGLVANTWPMCDRQQRRDFQRQCEDINNPSRRRCLFGVCGILDSIGNFISDVGQTIASAGTIKNSASLEVVGEVRYDFDTQSLGASASITGEVCILSVCAGFDESIP